MDLEGLVFSMIPPAGAASHEPSDEVARVIDGRPFLLADGREVCVAAIESDEVGAASVLAAKAAREALLSSKILVLQHGLPATGHTRASPGAVAATTRRIYLRNAEQGGRNAEFRLWGDPYHVVKQASGGAGVLAEQERFALVRGKVSC
jgi:hypothetical protein